MTIVLKFQGLKYSPGGYNFADRGVETMPEWNIPGPDFNGFLLSSPITPVSGFCHKDAHSAIAEEASDAILRTRWEGAWLHPCHPGDNPH